MKAIAADALVTATGGMKWESFRRSTNVEDRRGPQAIARDNAWFASTQKPAK